MFQSELQMKDFFCSSTKTRILFLCIIVHTYSHWVPVALVKQLLTFLQIKKSQESCHSAAVMLQAYTFMLYVFRLLVIFYAFFFPTFISPWPAPFWFYSSIFSSEFLAECYTICFPMWITRTYVTFLCHTWQCEHLFILLQIICASMSVHSGLFPIG